LVESWSGYFTQTASGPFAHASPAQILANSPAEYVGGLGAALRAWPMRMFLFSGRADKDTPQIASFARELRRLGLPVSLHLYASRKGEWRAQLEAGLQWAFGETASR
jgi:hypothetical protein